jgi:hypothetical protein
VGPHAVSSDPRASSQLLSSVATHLAHLGRKRLKRNPTKLLFGGRQHPHFLKPECSQGCEPLPKESLLRRILLVTRKCRWTATCLSWSGVMGGGSVRTSQVHSGRNCLFTYRFVEQAAGGANQGSFSLPPLSLPPHRTFLRQTSLSVSLQSKREAKVCQSMI